MDKELHKKYNGVITPLLTPFNEDKSIDYPALEALVNWQCDQNVNIMFPMGGSGEYKTLKLDERKDIIKCVVDTNAKRKMVFTGTGAASLAETIELSQFAEKNGADGIGVVIPTDIPDTEEALFDYYKAVNESISVPFMVYDPRGEGEYTATPALMRRMVDELEHLVAIKYRTLNAERMGLMTGEIGEDICVFSGSETVYLTDLSLGAVGCVGGGGNFYPNLMWKLQNTFENGDIPGARKIQHDILRAINVLEPVYWPLCGKIILQELGVPYKLVTRVEARPFTEKDVQNIRDYYRNLLT